MGTSFLEQGQMLTGKYGRRYMVKFQLSDGQKVQTYDLTESGKSYIGVAIMSESSRLRPEFLEPESEIVVGADYFTWPKDVFNFERRSLTYCGYVSEKSMNKCKPFVLTDSITLNDRYKIAYGIAKSFAQLHLQGYAFCDVPQVWCDEYYHVSLVGVPVQLGTKLASSDLMGQLGISAPELYTRGSLKIASVDTDRFLLASMIFQVCVGINPFAVVSRDPSLAYARFAFSTDVKNPLDDYGYEAVTRFKNLNDKIKAYFLLTFMKSVNDPLQRIDETDWAYTLEALY